LKGDVGDGGGRRGVSHECDFVLKRYAQKQILVGAAVSA
jgi:hypothetical protein